MSKTETTQVDQTSLEEFEGHRNNRRVESAVISDMQPIDEDAIQITFDLPFGDEEFSEEKSIDELHQLMESLGIDKSESSENLLTESVPVEYENKGWKTVTETTKNKSGIDHKGNIGKVKLLTVGTAFLALLGLPAVLFSIEPITLFTFSLILVVHILTGLLFQATVGAAVEDGSVDKDWGAPVTRNAYSAYESDSILNRIFSAAILHFI